jgi:mannose-6-phosphate isomerase-like protein (cupin superfamily)
MASPGDGSVLAAGDGERLVFGAATIVIKAATEDFAIWEELPPLLDTPLHVHEHEDEIFHILDGEHVFQCGDKDWTVGPGGFAFLPRGIAHAHRRVVPGKGHFVVMTSPGGFEGFFRMLAEAEQGGRLGPETYAAASARFGITWL